MPNPWVSLRHDQLIPVNKALNKNEHLEKGQDEEEIYKKDWSHGVVQLRTKQNSHFLLFDLM
jgi:hypothetical protein